MHRINIYKSLLRACLLLVFALSSLNTYAQTYCIQSGSDQITGVVDGYRHELWNQNSQGTACMTLGSGAAFSGEWDGILNYLARRGLGYNQTMEHQEVGSFKADYDCDYNPTGSSGNSYLSIYGWTVDPLIEYYIVEDWRNWIPSMANGVQSKGSFTIDGSVYDIYENTRTNQPSIVGNTTFQQYFSIRRDERNSGSIDITKHFEEWESLGMELGKLHEVSFVVEGYQSKGSFNFNSLDVVVTEGPTSSVEETDHLNMLNVYPNPNPGNLTIEVDEKVVGSSVKMFDQSGRTVFYQEKIENSVLKVSNLTPGLYLINVYNGDVNYKTKVTVF